MPDDKPNMFQVDPDASHDESTSDDDALMHFPPNMTEEQKEKIREKIRPIMRAMQAQGFRQAER